MSGHVFPWDKQSVIGLFCDPYLSDANTQNAAPETALQDVAGWLEELADDESVETGVSSAGLKETARLLLEAARYGEEGRQSFGMASKIAKWCTDIQTKLQSLVVGELLVLPGGWWFNDEKNGNQPLLYIFHCTGADQFAISICNTGQGVEYHALDAGAVPKEKRATSWRLLDVPRRNLTNFFWLNALFSACFTKKQMHKPELIYESLLPYVLPGGDVRAATDPDCLVYSTIQRSAASDYKVIPPALRLILQAQRVSEANRKRLMYTLRVQQLRKIWTALTPNGLSSLSQSERMIIECACRQVALKALREERAGLAPDKVAQARDLLMDVQARVAKSCEAERRISARAVQGLCAGAPLDIVGYAGFPGWELLAVPWFTRENRSALRHLMGAGSSQALPSLVDLARLEALEDPMELVLKTNEVCNALSFESQEILAKHRIGALIEAVFTRQIPPADMRWQSLDFTRERQCSILESLWNLFQHYITVVAMAFAPRRQYSAQILTARCLHLAFERVLRTPASTGNLPVTAALRAPVGGDLLPMWASMGETDLEGRHAGDACQGLPFPAPELARVWDALERHDASTGVRIWDSQIKSMKVNEATLMPTQDLIKELTQKVLHIDSSQRPAACHEDWPKWTWIFGWAFDQSEEVAKQAPEWCWWRDICMWCKYLCLDEASRRFSRKRSFQPRDVRINWKYSYCECGKQLTLRPNSLCGEVELSNMCPCSGAKVVRTGADLEAVGMKQGCKTEDDVVHAPRLPNFKGTLAQEEAEVLLSSLTTPYLRIPLLLHFLAADRLHALKETSLQDLVWSAMLEPGPWVDDLNPPEVLTAPAKSAMLLGSSYSLLHNEVRHGLHAIFPPLCSLCQQADELASIAAPEQFDGGAADILLFIVRLLVRFQAQLHLNFSEEHAADDTDDRIRVAIQEELRTFIECTARKHILRWVAAASQDVEARVRLHAHLIVSCTFSDLSLPQNLALYLQSSSYVNAWYAVGMEENMWAELQIVFEVLHRRRNDVVRILQAAAPTERQSVLDTVALAVSNYSTGGVAWEGGEEPKPTSTPEEEPVEHADLELDCELPANWPPHAPTIFKNMQLRFPDASGAEIIRAMVEADYHGGKTVTLLQKSGRSETEVEKADFARGASSHKPGGPGLWRCSRHDGAAVYNAQTGTLWLENGILQPIPAGIRRIPDFDDCFRQRPAALAPTSRPLLLARQCHVFSVQDTEEATLELQWWSSCYATEHLRVEAEDGLGQVYKETYHPRGAGALGYPWMPVDDYCRPDSSKVSGVAHGHFEKGSIATWLKSQVCNQGLSAIWAQLLERASCPCNKQDHEALVTLTMDGWLVQKGHFTESTLEVSALRETLVNRRYRCWLELRFACQGRPVIRGFSIGEFGRHVYREQVFTSDGGFSYAALEPKPGQAGGDLQYLGVPEPKACLESLVVTDDGLRVWVPPRALCGLLPEVLIESYCFWMHSSAAGYVLLTGEPLSPLVYNSLTHKLHVSVDSKGVACVERRNKTTNESWILASPLHAPSGSQLTLFMDMLAPLETASHVLFWVRVDADALSTRPDADAPAPSLFREVSGMMRTSFDPDSPDAPCGRDLSIAARPFVPTGRKEVAVVELPRLQMKFEPGADPLGKGLRLYSKEFQSFYVIDRRSCHNAQEWRELLGDPRGLEISALLACMPHAIILRSAAGALRIIASNADICRPNFAKKPFSTELIVDRRILRFLGQRHFVWEVHDSATLLLSSSLSGTLCLCLLLLLHRDYQRCVRYMQSICFDEKISREELRLLKALFVSTKGDVHPDAHALRLKLAVAMAQHNPRHCWLPKVIPNFYKGYLNKLTHVSRACRLLFREEAALIQIWEEKDKIPDVAKRRSNFISAVLGGASSVKLQWSQEHPAQAHQNAFAKEAHQQWMERNVKSIWRQNLAIAESEAGKSRNELTELIDLSRRCDDVDWSGAHCTLFTTIYGILSGVSSLVLDGCDISVDFVRLALDKYWLRKMRLERGSQDDMYVINTLLGALAMRILGKHLQLPEWTDLLNLQKQAGWGFVHMFHEKWGQPWLVNLFTVINNNMSNIISDSGLFRRERIPINDARNERIINIPRDETEADLHHLIPRPPARLDNFSRRSASLESLKHEMLPMLSMPLESLANFSVTHFSAASHVPPNAFTKDTLKVLPAGMTRVASDITTRLENGHAAFMEKSAERQVCSLSCIKDIALFDLDVVMQALDNLESAVRSVWSSDLVAMQRAQHEVLCQANQIAESVDFWLRRCGGLETHAWLEWCIGAELDGARGFEETLRNVNAEVGNPTKIGLEALELMLRTSRIAQAQLALVALHDLRSAAANLKAAGLPRPDGSGVEELQGLAERAAQLLSARRSYTKSEDMQIEPAFLFFEYVTGFLIRDAQVALIRRFVATASADESLVAQMIMGAGKTTCIAPMLTLLLGNGGRLVLNVVPKNLLAQTRNVMRKIFGQLLAKRVVTLDFSRMTGQEDPFDVKLVQIRLFDAQRDAAVVCATPAAIKSLFLRHLELLEINSLSVAQIAADQKAINRSRDYVSQERLKKRIANHMAQAEKNRAMTAHLGEIIVMLRRNSCALIDEVDLVLHPLKSELNFPIGDMEIYDLGGDRWHMVVHLLDALFLKTEGHAASGSFYPDIREGALDDEAEAAEAKAEVEAIARKEEAKAKAKAARAAALARGKAAHNASTRGKPKARAKPKRKKSVKGRRGSEEAPPEEELAVKGIPAEEGPAEVTPEATSPAAKDEGVRKRGGEIAVEVASRVSQLEVEIPKLVEQGYRSLALQRQPHLVILSTAFYHSVLRQPLAEWLASWILMHDDAVGLWVVGIGLEELSYFLASDLHELLASGLKTRVEEAATTHLRKLLTLGREWLFNLLPHILSKVDRVQYGLLTEAELILEQQAASSRRLLAVPFVGKDKPSPAAEFAQPDVLIGFTILAYRYEGLRLSDIASMLHHLQQKAGRESGPWNVRPTCALFEWWKDLGRKRFIHKGLKDSESETVISWEVESKDGWKPLRSAINEQVREAFATKQTVVRFKAQGGNSYEIDLECMVQRNVATRKESRIRQITTAPGMDHLRLPELQALAVSGSEDEEKKKEMEKKKAAEEAEKKKKEESLDEEGAAEETTKTRRTDEEEEQPGHLAVAVELLGSVPEILLWYLLEMVFDAVLRQQPFKLSATGQELGSSMLFTSRIGFSGTPSSLLPQELGACLFAAENEGEILSVLSNAEHVVDPLIEMSTDWTPSSILDRVACCETPQFHALIDTGALVMGLTNEEVARALLRKLPPRLFDGVVYFDDRDAPMVIVRNARQPLLLAEAGVPMDRRFTFFDQVHTTGTDTKQPLQSFAALTVSASMTFRDYAQGAWRMRGLGKGQKLQLLLTPELVKRVQNAIRVAVESEDARAAPLCLDDIVCFLLSNGFESEGRQAAALEMQNLGTIWRRLALNKLMKSTTSEREQMQKEVEAFKESLRFPVDDVIREPPGLIEKMREAISEHKGLMAATDIATCNALVAAASGSADDGGGDLGVEITRQQEKEQEKQQEKEKEVEIQVGRERDAEAPWPLTCLQEAALPTGVFYTLAQFRMKGLPSGSELKCSPSSLISSNHTVNDLLSMGARRLKNVILLFVFSHPSGKRTIAMSLAEGAALRRAAHLNIADLPTDCMLWLRADSDKVPESSHLLMGSGKRSDMGSGLMQARRLDAARQMLRFFNCDLDFKPEEVTVSVGTLSSCEVDPPQRQLFINAVLRARRREACAWKDTPLGEIVRGSSEHLAWAEALVVRLHGCMTRVLHISSAVEMFKMFDASGHGTILFDTFQKGLCSMLPDEFSATETRELFQQADRSDNGHLTFVDIEELFRYGAVAGGGPEPEKIKFAPTPRGSPREADEEAGTRAETSVEASKVEDDTEIAALEPADETVDKPADKTVDTPGRADIAISEAGRAHMAMSEEEKEKRRVISVEAGEALVSDLVAQIDELFDQYKSLVGDLYAARDRNDHSKFVGTLHMIASLFRSDVSDAAEAMSIIANHGSNRKMRKDKTAFQLAVLSQLAPDDSALTEDLEKMYKMFKTFKSVVTAAANIEKEALKVHVAWSDFQQMWSDMLRLPAELSSVHDFERCTQSCPKSLVVQLFVLERLYRINPVAVVDVAFNIALPALLLALSRCSEEDSEQFAGKVILWALCLLVQLVKAVPGQSKVYLSKPEFVEVGNLLWTNFQHKYEILNPLCYVLSHVPVQITRWQVLNSEEGSPEEWQTYEAEQALAIRHAVKCDKPAVYFTVDDVNHIIDLKRLVEINLDTNGERQIREVTLDISEPHL